MIRYLSQLFNIRAEEWPRLLILYLMSVLFTVGITWGGLTVQAAFLFKVGVQSLPWVLLINAVASIVASALYSPFVDRIANDKILMAISTASTVAIVICNALLIGGLDLGYTLLYLLSLVVQQIFLNLHWWTYVSGFYDTRAAKRIIPLLSTATPIAVIIAGQTMPLLNRYLSSGVIVFVWAGTLMVITLIAWLMPTLLRERQSSQVKAEETVSSRSGDKDAGRTSFVHNIREGYRYVSRSSFLRWLALSTLLIMLLAALLNYRTSQIFVMPDNFESGSELSSYLGSLTAWVSLILLPFQLFLMSRLVGRIGLGNANLIFPVGTLAICGTLIAWPNLATASLGHLDRTVFWKTFRNPPDNLLYNAVPLRVKGRARAFIGGLVAPMGFLIGGGLLLLSQALDAAWLPVAFIGLAAAVYLLSSLFVRGEYSDALITMLEQEDYSFLLAAPSDLTVTDTATLNWLTNKLQESSDDDFRIFMARLIAEVGGEEAVPLLSQVATESEGTVRATILDILAAAEVRGEAAGALYVEFATDPDSRVRQSAISGLEQWAGPENEQFLNLAIELLRDPDGDVQAQVLSPLIRSGDLFYLATASRTLTDLLGAEEADRRTRGVRVLGQVGDVRFVRTLVPYLADPDDQVRMEAAMAVEALSQNKLPDQIAGVAVERLTPLAGDPVERVRQATVTILGRIDTQETQRGLVRFLTDPSPRIREMAADRLVAVGKEAIPVVSPTLEGDDTQLHKTAATILSRIDRERYADLVMASLDKDLQTIYHNRGRIEAMAVYITHPSVSILESILREENARLGDEIFYLLTAVYEPEAVALVAESITSQDSRVRANAAEALESLTSVQTAGLIAPLFEPAVEPAALLRVGRDQWGIAPPDTSEVVHQIATDPSSAWMRTIMTFALGEIGAELEPPLTEKEIESLLKTSLYDPVADVRIAAHAARRMIDGLRITEATQEEEKVLSTIERIIFLKEVPFFRSMTVDNLKALADICEEEMFSEDALIFDQGDPGGALYVVVSGRVAIEREGRRKGSVVRLMTVDAHSYFGETTLFEERPRSSAARAIQDTLTLRLRREPLVALLRQHPDLGMELINVLSQRLHDANERIIELTRSMPRELDKFYDKFT